MSSTGPGCSTPGPSGPTAGAVPQALVVTPNTREATALLGTPVETVSEARDAARQLGELGPAWVVVKGGHLADDAGDAVDVVYNTHRRA